MASRMDTLGLSLFSQLKSDFQSFMRGSQAEGARGPSPAFERMQQLIEGNREEELQQELTGMETFAVMERGANDVTLLHIAAEVGNLEIVRQLILAGAQLNVSDRNGWAPLHCAARNGHGEVITALFCAGADCNITTLDRNTPLHYFVRSADPTSKYYDPVLTMLIEHSSGLVNLTNRLGETVLHFAAIGSKNVAARKLLEAGANPGFANKYGESPLHVAARNGNAELIELFLANGASPLKVGRNGTPGDVAEKAFRHDIAEHLKEAEFEWKKKRRTTEHENTLDALRRMQEAGQASGSYSVPSEELRSQGSKRPTKQVLDRPVPPSREQKGSLTSSDGTKTGAEQSQGIKRPRAKSEVPRTMLASVSKTPTVDTGLTASQALTLSRKSVPNIAEPLSDFCVPESCQEVSEESESVSESSFVEPGDATARKRATTYQEPPSRERETQRRKSPRKACSTGEAQASKRKSRKKAKKMPTRAHVVMEEEVIAYNPLLVEEEPLTNSGSLYKERRVSVMCLEEQEKPVEVPREVEQVVPLHRLPSWEQLPSSQGEDSVEYLKFQNALAREELAAMKERLLQADMELTVTHKLLENTETRLRNAQNENFRYQKKIDLMRKECTCT